MKKQFSFLTSVIILELLAALNLLLFITIAAILLTSILLPDLELGMLTFVAFLKLPLAIVSALNFIWIFFTIRYLKQNKKWARISAIIIATLTLFVYPIGTFLGVFILYGLTLGYPKENAS